MKIFQINDNASIVCQWVKTRMAFKHTAVLMVGGVVQDEVKICYQNRTWESFEFESVINKLLDKTGFLGETERTEFMAKCSGRAHAEVKKSFGAIAAVAALGEVFHAGDQKAANDWKARMLKAGLENSGLVMPEDWETLDEDTKTARLNAVINQLQKD
jgi:hypothetical protein